MLGGVAHAAEPLGLTEAVEIALTANDPSVRRFEESAAGLDENAIADSQLPDPELKLGVVNMPLDTFDFGEQPMTQGQIWLRQSFPSGDTLALTGERRRAEAAEQRAGLNLREAQIVYDVRRQWLELYYWIGARDAVRESRVVMVELVKIIEAEFATGMQPSNQNLLRTELELGLLDDRAVEVERSIETVRADLARLVGRSPAQRPLPVDLPALPMPPDPDTLAQALVEHPAVRVEDARIIGQNRDIDIANEKYAPSWAVDAGYGLRGGSRSDFGSVVLSMNLPLFTENRQDRRVAAATRMREAARMDRDVQLLEMRQALDRSYADWTRLADRILLYEQVVIERARANAEAALEGYQNQVSDFAELIRSELEEIDAVLRLRRLRVDRAQAQARLLYLAGE